MIIVNDTTILEFALQDKDEDGQQPEDQALSLLVLSGCPPCTAAQIHDFLEANDALETWQRYFLISNLDAITAAQRDDWFLGPNPNRYAMLRGAAPNKKVARQGDVAELMGIDKQPSIIKILSLL
jgi:hypothetical protein